MLQLSLSVLICRAVYRSAEGLASTSGQPISLFEYETLKAQDRLAALKGKDICT